ncbi:MAG: S8 family serine peptidase, partial [Verrucomicrobiae bacterium]|nr:S8 family serine peptidase [Verrucomicrobiae bacterium]
MIRDGNSDPADDHATHVAGTVGAAGVNAQALGMAPSVTIHSYDWDNDESEIANVAAVSGGQAGRIYLSNHSYGFITGWEYTDYSGNFGWHWFGDSISDTEDADFGLYSSYSRTWDQICFNAPFYLPFRSAGNDRNDGPQNGDTIYYWDGVTWASKSYNSSTDPKGDGVVNGGYDSVDESSTAKNIMTVGSVTDAVLGGSRNISVSTSSSFSSWGPADDGRVKPDIVANGDGLLSSLAQSNSDYGTYSGTSMSSPNATGSAVLLSEYYFERTGGQYLRASDLKALIIHTADDIGRPGPDYSYGWGLMNAKTAADLIKSHTTGSTVFGGKFIGHLQTKTLTEANSNQTIDIYCDGSGPLRATICWTDPAGTASTALDDRTAKLVNDLDLRIEKAGGGTSLPWKLNPIAPTANATIGDNTVDNVEQVYIPSPAEGYYQIRVTRKGSLTNGQQVYSVVISGNDSPPSEPDLTDLSDTGISNSDNLTADNTPTFTGFASAGASVTLASDLSGTIGTGTANGSGNWTITSNLLADGLHQITASENGGSPSSPLAVTIDTTPPAVLAVPDLLTTSDSGVSNSDNLTNDGTPTFAVSSVSGNLVEILANGSLVASSISTGSNQITSSSLADGSYLVTARSSDAAGNTSAASSALNIVIDTTAPVYPSGMRITSATDSGLSPIDNITNNVNPVVSGTSEAGTVVYLFRNGSAAGTHPTGGSWTLPLSGLGNGIHTITAKGEDAAGNVGIESPIPLQITIDTIAPAAPTNLRLTAATDTGVSNADNLTRLTNPSVTGSAESGARVTVFRNGSNLGNATSTGTWTMATSGLSEGIHAFTAQQTDVAGNLGPVSGATNIEVDLTPPAAASAPVMSSASDTGASNSDRITRLQTLAFSGTSEAGGRITLLADNTPVGTTGSTGTWSLTSSSITAGTHDIRARAEDRAGNVALADSPPTEVTIILSADPPTNVHLDPSSDLGFSDTDSITSDKTPLIGGDAPAGSTIQLSIGDAPSETSLGTGPGGPGWAVVASTLPGGDGVKVIKAKVLDIAGNLSAPATVQLEIRTSNPTTPIGLSLAPGSDSGTSTTDRITNVNTPTVKGLVNLSGQPSIRIRVEADGVLVGNQTVTTGVWEVTTSALADGVRVIRAIAEDFAGNLSNPSAALTLTVDTVAPLAPGELKLAPADDTGVSNTDKITRVTRPEIQGIAEPGPVVLFINGIQQPGTLTSDGTWSHTPASDLPEGTTLFSARQSDAAGNQGPESAPLAVTVDLTPPGGSTLPPQLHPSSDLGPIPDDRLTSDDTPRLFGQTDPGDVAAIVIDGTEAGIAIADGGGIWTFDAPALTDGPHLILARRSDQAGNLGEESTTLEVTIDTDAPQIAITKAAGQNSPTVDEPVRFALAFTQPVFGLQSGGLLVSGPAGTGAALTLSGADGGTDYQVEITGTTGEGLVHLDVAGGAVTDLAGNPNPAGIGPDNEVLKKLLPTAVSGVTATRDTHPDKVVVTWETLPGATGYRIFRHAFATPGVAEEIGQGADTDTEFEDTGVPPGIWHSYWVRAVDEDGTGPFGVPDSGRAQRAANEK